MRGWRSGVLFPQIRAEFVNQIPSALRGEIDAAPQQDAAAALFRRRLPHLRRDGPRSISSGDLPDREGLPSVCARNHYRRFHDISETLQEATIANADVAIVFVVEGGESKFDGVIEKILRVLRPEAPLESTSGAVPFVRKVPCFFKTRDQNVGDNGGRAHHGLQIFLHPPLAIERRQPLGGDGIHRGCYVLRANPTGKAQK